MTAKPPPLDYPKGQTDAMVQIAPHCPTCGRPWKAQKRVCRRCGQGISSSHKWQMIPAGPGLWAIEHRDCDNPTSYPKAAPPAPEEPHGRQD
jgi:hypothetical protein